MKSFHAGRYIVQGGYSSFHPQPVNRAWHLDDMEIVHLLSRADREVGRLDMYSEYVPDIDMFIRMHVIKEATQSTRIEGTNTNMEEALLDVSDVPAGRYGDWEEVQNYIQAMETSISGLEELPFSTRLIREAHAILLTGVRGSARQPGEFRTSQNWIGGTTIADAVFVPPPHYVIPELMSDLEKFVHNDGILLPHLLKTALLHYQFETIHPFLDGNGRVGRLMITLYLVSRRILKRPVLYISDFFEWNRSAYYTHLMRVREEGDIAGWFKFFLTGVIETAAKGIATFDRILKLQKATAAKVQTLGPRAGNARKVVESLYNRPMINAHQVRQVTGLSKPATYTLIGKLEELGILSEVTGAQRGRVYVFSEYLDLFR